MTRAVIRDLEGVAEYRRAVAFQESIWGVGFSERVPASLMKVAQRVGGVAAGAFDPDGDMVGFVYGITGIAEGAMVHWSDILAVRPGLRDAGLGRRLKAFQRDKVLAVGVTRMHWTFDPLESRNAYLNLGRLGAVVREYAVDMYGASDSPLHRGLGTDRFVVTWELDASRVAERLAGARPPTGDDLRGLPVAFTVDLGMGPSLQGPSGAAPGVPGGAESPQGPGRAAPPDPVPDVPGPEALAAALARGRAAGGLRVPIPVDIQGLKDRNADLAAAWRAATRAVLHPLLGRGWEVRDLVRHGAQPGSVSHYLVVPPESHSDP